MDYEAYSGDIAEADPELYAFAHLPDGAIYGYELIPRWVAAEALQKGFVILYGFSDDLVELEGAVSDEFDAWKGVRLGFFPDGRIQRLNGTNEHDDPACPWWVNVEWCPLNSDACWGITTNIPHATFTIIEDGTLYCRGIVFRLAALCINKEGE